MIVQSSGKNILDQGTVLRKAKGRSKGTEGVRKRIWTRPLAAKSKRQDKIKGLNSPSGPKNNPKSSKMKMLLTCSKRSKPLDPGQLEQFRLKFVQFVLQREM